MPLPISHGLMGASIVAALHPDATRRRLPLLLGAFLANCADLDFALVHLTRDKSWHRGFTHSLTFAALLTLALLLTFGLPRARQALAYGLAYASHALLDFSLAKHGDGVELFWPFSELRTRLDLVGLSEVPSRMPASELLSSLLLELLIFSALLTLALTLRRRNTPLPARPTPKNFDHKAD